jgi:hypothetical protein
VMVRNECAPYGRVQMWWRPVPLPDLILIKSGRACLPPAGAFRTRQTGAA